MNYYLCKDQLSNPNRNSDAQNRHCKNGLVDLRELISRRESNEKKKRKGAIDFYRCRNYSPADLDKKKPWKADVHYFSKVYISSLALMKMALHAESGGNIEVMGMMTGKIIENGFIIMDSYSLPVVGTETRVNAQSESYEYMASYLDSLKKSGYRNENIVGWYHSHPGYGCWLSGIDVSTESLNQTHQDPYLAVVIDPKQTKTNGKVEIGAFRTYPEGYNNNDENTKERLSDVPLVPNQKLKDYGVHSSRYYVLDIEVIKCEEDELVLRNLSNNFWISSITGLDNENCAFEDPYNDAQMKNKNVKMMKQVDKFVQNFDNKAAKIFNKWRSDDMYVNIHENTNFTGDNKLSEEPEGITPKNLSKRMLTVPKEQRFETFYKSDMISHELEGPEEDYEERGKPETLSINDSYYLENVDSGLHVLDRLDETLSADNQRKNIRSFKSDYEDIIMSNTESAGEEEDEDYASIDSDTSNDNASTTSISLRRTIERSKKPLSMSNVKQLTTGNKYRLLNISGKLSSSNLSLFSNSNEKGLKVAESSNVIASKPSRNLIRRRSKNDNIANLSTTNTSTSSMNNIELDSPSLEKICGKDSAEISNITKVIRDIAVENLKNSISRKIVDELLLSNSKWTGQSKD